MASSSVSQSIHLAVNKLRNKAPNASVAAHLVNTDIIPILYYYFQIVPFSKNLLEKLQTTISLPIKTAGKFSKSVGKWAISHAFHVIDLSAAYAAIRIDATYRALNSEDLDYHCYITTKETLQEINTLFGKDIFYNTISKLPFQS